MTIKTENSAKINSIHNTLLSYHDQSFQCLDTKSKTQFGSYAWDTVLFSVHRDGKVSEPESIFHLPWMQKKTACTLFSVLADGNLSTHGAIYHPLWTENSVHAVFLCIRRGRKISYFPFATRTQKNTAWMLFSVLSIIIQ